MFSLFWGAIISSKKDSLESDRKWWEKNQWSLTLWFV
jgi:hypothetical protein